MNYTKISFPLFGLEINPGRVLDLGPVQIYYYGLIIALGLTLAAIYGLRRCKQFGIKQDDVIDGALCIIPFAVLCARLYYCAFQWDYYKEDPISVLYIWNGGLAIYGGIIFGALAVLYMSRRKKISFFTLGDMAVPAVMLGQAMGRWGNFCNGEAFGSETTLPWRMGLCNSETFYRTIFVHPTFFYESFWNIIGFIWINIFYKKRKYHGEVIIWYFCWYGLGRTFIEMLRTDSLMIGGFIRVSSLLSAMLVIVLLPIGIFLRHLCKKYTEQGLLQEDEITSIKKLLTIFICQKKGIPVPATNPKTTDAQASENN